LLLHTTDSCIPPRKHVSSVSTVPFVRVSAGRDRRHSAVRSCRRATGLPSRDQSVWGAGPYQNTALESLDGGQDCYKAAGCMVCTAVLQAQATLHGPD
jgi:hypothetical protein